MPMTGIIRVEVSTINLQHAFYWGNELKKR